MHHPRIIIFEQDGRLALILRRLADEHRWSLRESRQVEACFHHLATPGPVVLVVRISPDPLRELQFLERVKRLLPSVAVVAVGDHEESTALAGLAWDLGADFALFPPLPRELLPEVVAGLMSGAAEAVLPELHDEDQVDAADEA